MLWPVATKLTTILLLTLISCVISSLHQILTNSDLPQRLTVFYLIKGVFNTTIPIRGIFTRFPMSHSARTDSQTNKSQAPSLTAPTSTTSSKSGMIECPWLTDACPSQKMPVMIIRTFKVKFRLMRILDLLDLSLQSSMTEPPRTTSWTVVMTVQLLKEPWSLSSTPKKSTEITKEGPTTNFTSNITKTQMQAKTFLQAFPPTLPN